MKAAAYKRAPVFFAALLMVAAHAWPCGPAARAAQTTPAPASATPADYRSRVGRAARQLEELAAFCEELERGEKYEAWGSGEFNPTTADELPGREENAMTAVRRLLPAAEKVSAAGVSANADNRWLHEALAAYERDTARFDNSERAGALRAVAGRLRSLESALAGAGAEGPPRDKDAEKGRLATILRRPDFDRQTAEGGALRRLVEGAVEWLRGVLPEFKPPQPGTSALFSRGAQYLVFGSCLLVLAYVGWRLWSGRVRGAKKKAPERGARIVLGERLEENQTAADLLEEAERLARAGDPRAAIRKAYVALLVELGDRRVVRLAQHKTNRDYLHSVRAGARPGLYAEMLPLTSDYEQHWYGLRAADEKDWGSFRDRCRRALGAA